MNPGNSKSSAMPSSSLILSGRSVSGVCDGGLDSLLCLLAGGSWCFSSCTLVSSTWASVTSGRSPNSASILASKWSCSAQAVSSAPPLFYAFSFFSFSLFAFLPSFSPLTPHFLVLSGAFLLFPLSLGIFGSTSRFLDLSHWTLKHYASFFYSSINFIKKVSHFVCRWDFNFLRAFLRVAFDKVLCHRCITTLRGCASWLHNLIFWCRCLLRGHASSE